MYKPGRPKKYDPHTGSGHAPPSTPGEYRIRDTLDNSIDYVGETCNLKRRMNEHVRAGKLDEFNTFEWKQADESSNSRTRREHEKEKIKQHSPWLNKSKGGEGPIARNLFDDD